MKFTLSYAPSADLDLEESIKFYRERSERLDDRLLQEINVATESILNAPLSFPVIFKNVRKKSLVKFPFTILFTVDEKQNQIVVIAIWHFKRNPKKLRRRI